MSSFGSRRSHRLSYPISIYRRIWFFLTAAKKAQEDKINLIITADIGVRDHEAVSYASTAGIDVIVCDHHLPSGESVPKDAVAVLCLPQDGCTYPNPSLAACGVSFKLAHAMMLRSPKYRERPEMINRILRSMLKIVSIGTVADVVSLATIENRSIVALGLRVTKWTSALCWTSCSFGGLGCEYCMGDLFFHRFSNSSTHQCGGPIETSD